MNSVWAITSYILAVMSGLCFVSGLAVMSGGRKDK